MMSSALMDGPYRYTLTRRWGLNGSTVCWIMLNPSTANAHEDDPTIRRCIGFSKAWGYAAMTVVNLFALRATDPRELREAADPVGPENDVHVTSAVIFSDLTVAAWGTKGTLHSRDAATRRAWSLHYLRLTKDGHPEHPLYLPKSLTPTPWGRE